MYKNILVSISKQLCKLQKIKIDYDTIKKIIVNFSIVRKEQKMAKHQKISEERRKFLQEFIAQNNINTAQDSNSFQNVGI